MTIPNYESVREILDDRRKRLPDTALFAWTDEQSGNTEQVTSEEFWEDMLNLGTWLFRNDYRDKTFVMVGDTSYNWVLLYLALTCGGNVVVPVYKNLTEAALHELATHCDCNVIVYSGEYEDTAKACAEKIHCPVLLLDTLEECVSSGKLYRDEGDLSYENYKLDPDKVSVIVYTSGTTGISKGVMLSQRNMAVNTAATCRLSDFRGSSLHAIPMHHIFGISLVLLMTVISGETVYLNLSLRNLFTDMERAKPRLFICVPLLMNYLYTFLTQETAKLGSRDKALEKVGGKLKIVLCGGAALDVKIVESLKDFGIVALEGYGITECAPVISAERDVFHKTGSVGTVIDICEVKIDEPDAGGNGEVLVKGPNVMLGYYKMEQETKEVMAGGWFHTGDIGRFDEDGLLYITGRKKNLIILSNGENVSPEELEAKLQKLPMIEEVIVYGKDEMILAQAYLNQDYVAEHGNCESELKRAVEEINLSMPIYKRIEKVIIRDKPFERTSSTKKIIRRID